MRPVTHCFEAYLNDPHGTEPSGLLVDVYAPLESASTPRKDRR